MPTTRLHQSIEHILADAAAMLDVLRREQQALIAGDVTAIETVTAEKHQQLARMEITSRDHAAALAAAGFPPGMNATPSWLAASAAPPARDLAPAWREIQSLLAQCQALNRANGGLIETHRRHTQRALSILLGAPADTTLYGPGGAATADGISRTWARV
jgi:flagella synthesis protein FlgN